MHAAAAHRDEEELVSLLRSRDESAFLTLVARFHPTMVRVAQSFVESRAVAEEVAQEAWLGVLEGIDTFEGRSSLRSWIFAIVVNSARSRARREGRSTAFSSLEEDDDQEPAVDPSRFLPDDHPRWPGHWASRPERWPEERTLLKETLGLAQAAIDELPPAQRTVLVLRDVAEWSSKEVCDELGITEANQRVLLHRGRSRVRAALERHLGSGR